MASVAAAKLTGAVAALMIAHEGHLNSLIVRMDLGVDLTGTVVFPKPTRPKYSTVRISRMPSTFSDLVNEFNLILHRKLEQE